LKGLKFDSVNHNILLDKLYAINVPHLSYRTVDSMVFLLEQNMQLNDGMPQGSWLGLLTFLVLIDDLEVNCLLHKNVDDSARTTSACKPSCSSY